MSALPITAPASVLVWPPVTQALALTARLPLLVVGIVASVLFIRSGLRSLDVPWPITNPEGATIAAALRVRDGEPLYQDFRQYPYLITPYPPGQVVASGLLSRALGLDLMGTVVLARGLTLASSVACAVLIGLLASAAGARPLAALAGAGLFLPLPFLDLWAFAARPDLQSLALTLAAALTLLRRPDRPWIAATISVLAFFTKQTVVAFPIAAVLWLLWNGRRGGAARFAGTWVGLAGGGLLLAEAASGGQYLLNTVLAHLNTPKNGFDFALRDFMPLPQAGWLPLGLAALAVLAELGHRRRLGLLSLYWLATLGIAFVTLRNAGGDANYLIEPAAAACPVAALAIDWVWRRLDRGALVGIGGAALLAGAGLLWGLPLATYWHDEGGIHPQGRLPVEEIARAERVLSQEPLAVLLAGRPLVVSDTFHVSMLTTTGFLDVGDLERRIKRSEFDLIVLSSDVAATRWWKRVPIFPEPLRRATKDTYVPAGRVGRYWLYVPEDRRPARGQ